MSAIGALPNLPSLRQLPSFGTLAKNAGLVIPQVRWSGQPETDADLWRMAQEAQGDFTRLDQERLARHMQARPDERRLKQRLDPNDPATYEKLQPNIERAAETSKGWSQFFQGLMRVLDVVDIPRMATNKVINLAVGAKANSPDPSIIGGERIYGADFMRHFGVENRALQLVGGFVWDVLTDPLTWITGFGGVLRKAGTVGVGGVTRSLLRGTAKQTRKLLGQGQFGKAMVQLAERSGLSLARLKAVQEGARAVGLADDLARASDDLVRASTQALKAATGEAAEAIGKAATGASDELATILTLIREADPAVAGKIFGEIADAGRLSRQGLRFSTEPLRQFPLIGRGVRKILPAARTPQLLPPGVLGISPRVGGALAGAAVGSTLGEVYEAPVAGAIGGALLGAFAGPRAGRFLARSEQVAKIRGALRRMFAHKPNTAVAQLEERFRTTVEMLRRHAGEELPQRIIGEIDEFGKRLNRVTGVQLTDDQLLRTMTAAMELEAPRIDDMLRILDDVLGPQAAPFADKAIRGGRAIAYQAPELWNGQATHAIFPDPDTGRWAVFAAETAEDGGFTGLKRVAIEADEATARQFVDNAGGIPVLLEADDGGRLLSPAALEGPPGVPPAAAAAQDEALRRAAREEASRRVAAARTQMKSYEARGYAQTARVLDAVEQGTAPADLWADPGARRAILDFLGEGQYGDTLWDEYLRLAPDEQTPEAAIDLLRRRTAELGIGADYPGGAGQAAADLAAPLPDVPEAPAGLDLAAPAEAAVTRDSIRQSLISLGRPEAEVDATLALSDAVAETWAKKTGRAVEEFYPEYIAGVGGVEEMARRTAGGVLPEPPPLLQIDAYHGSPHQFGRFTTDAIGTGEGSQAFGWGLYFSDEASIARHYANQGAGGVLSNARIAGREFSGWDGWGRMVEGERPMLLMSKYLEAPSDDAFQAIRRWAEIDLVDWMRQKGLGPGPPRWGSVYADRMHIVDEHIDFLQDLLRGGRKAIELPGKRNLYKAQLWSGKKEALLQWDQRVGPDVWKAIGREGQRSKTPVGRALADLAEYVDVSYQLDEIAALPAAEHARRRLALTTKWDRLNDYRKRIRERAIPLVADDAAGQIAVERLFDRASTGMDGQHAYRLLSEMLGSDRNASLFLKRAGLDGISYPAGTLSGAESGARNYVVFDDAAVDIIGHQLYQGAKGATAFDPDSGRAILYALREADASTLPHEFAHVFRRVAADIFPDDVAALNEWAGVAAGGRWTRAAEEKFARAFERYLADGLAPTKRLRPIFERFKEWMIEVYRKIVGSDIDVKLSEDARRLYDRLLGGRVRRVVAPKPAAAAVAKKHYTTFPREWIEVEALYDWGQKGLRVAGQTAIKTATRGWRARKTFDRGWIPQHQLGTLMAGTDTPVLREVRKLTDEVWPVFEKQGKYWHKSRYLAPKQAIAEAQEALAAAGKPLKARARRVQAARAAIDEIKPPPPLEEVAEIPYVDEFARARGEGVAGPAAARRAWDGGSADTIQPGIEYQAGDTRVRVRKRTDHAGDIHSVDVWYHGQKLDTPSPVPLAEARVAAKQSLDRALAKSIPAHPIGGIAAPARAGETDLFGRPTFQAARGRQGELMVPGEHGVEMVGGPAHAPREAALPLREGVDEKIARKFGTVQEEKLLPDDVARIERAAIQGEAGLELPEIPPDDILFQARRQGHMTARERKYRHLVEAGLRTIDEGGPATDIPAYLRHFLGDAYSKGMDPGAAWRLGRDRVEAIREGVMEIKATRHAAEAAVAGYAPPPDAGEWQILKMDKQLAPELAEILDGMSGRQVARLGAEQAAGVPVSAMETEAVSYVPHTLVDDELAKSEGLWQAVRRLAKGRKQGFQRMRQLRDRSIAEINDALAKMGKDPMFTADPIAYETARHLAHIKAMGTAQFLHETAQRFGKLVPAGEAVPAGMAKLPALKSKFFTGLKDYAFDSETVDFLTRLDQLWARPGPLLDAYDKLLTTMKSWMLVAPAYHMRNFGSNIWLSAAGDGFSMSGWTHGYKALRAVRGGKLRQLNKIINRKLVNPATDSPWTYKELVDAVDDLGLTHKTFFEAEFPKFDQAVRQSMVGTAPREWRKIFKPWQWNQLNRSVGSFVEDGSKVGHVITRMMKGDDIGQAVASAQKYLFNYQALTPFERNVMRRVLPFYSWARLNSALQLELLLERPEFIAMMPKLKGNIEASLPTGQVVPAALRPSYVRREAGSQLFGGLRPVYSNLPNFFPLGELKYLTPGGVIRGAMDLLNPMIKMPVELGINKDFFFDRPIRSYPGQREKFLGLNVPPELRHVAGVFRPASEVNRIAYGIQRGERAPSIAGRLAGFRLFEGNLPREIASFDRRQSETRGYMRARAKMAIANQDLEGAERIAGLFDENAMPEDALKVRIMIAQAQGDFTTAKELALALRDMHRQRRAEEASLTEVRDLATMLRQERLPAAIPETPSVR